MGIIGERIRQKYRTMSYPDGPAPELPERWRGEPLVGAMRAAEAAALCPTGAVAAAKGGAALDMGRCIFCGECAAAGVEFSRKYAMARFSRPGLKVAGKGGENQAANAEALSPEKSERLAMIRRVFGKSLKLRQVSAGGCNACEADCNVLGTLAWDMGRFGISFVASPKHADGILVTGPVTDHMKLALEKTCAAVPTPRVVIAVGACAVSGGIYASNREGRGRLDEMFPVDLYIPGCPPHPLVILEGLLRLLGRVGEPAKLS